MREDLLVEDILSSITIDDITSKDIKDLAEVVGIEAVVRVVVAFAGTAIYIPLDVLTAMKKAVVRKQFVPGKSIRTLALRVGVSESTICSWINQIPAKKCPSIGYEQTRLFDPAE